jgi:hypothetical protein
MRVITLVVSMTVVAVAACSGKVGETSSANSIADADAGADASTRTVFDHRPQGVTCAPTPVGAEPVIWDAGLPEGTRFDCQKNEDCTAHPGGRCVYTYAQEADPPPPSNNLGTRCFYDECSIDSDCPASSVCQCGSGGAATNTCSPIGNCRVDADCASGFCSPSKDDCADFNGYFCHTSSDQCASDDDCDGVSGIGAKCVANTSSGVWSCEQIGCASAGAP